MKSILATLSAFFGAIPGLLVLITGIGTPPGKQVLFGAIVECFGVLTLLILYVNRGKLKSAAKKRITKSAITCGLFALLCLVAYLALMHRCVITSKEVEKWGEYPVYMPLWVSGDPAKLVKISGGRQAAVDDAGPGGMEQALARMPNRSMAYLVTDAVIVVLFLGFFTSLTTAFGVAGFHVAEP